MGHPLLRNCILLPRNFKIFVEEPGVPQVSPLLRDLGEYTRVLSTYTRDAASRAIGVGRSTDAQSAILQV